MQPLRDSGNHSTRVLILGAGDHGQVVADALLQGRNRGQLLQPIGYLDDDPALVGKRFLNLPVLGSLNEQHQFEYDAVVVAIGENSIRARIFERLKKEHAQFVNVIHPSAVLASGVELGAGVMIMAGVVINVGSSIGDNVILNTSCSVDHHGSVGAHAHLAPGVHLGGRVTVGEGALIGVGAAVVPGRRIGPWSVLGAGSCLISDIPAGVTAVGVPAAVVKE